MHFFSVATVLTGFVPQLFAAGDPEPSDGREFQRGCNCFDAALSECHRGEEPKGDLR
jgi:hypothetical protein